jgi:hypothetical protein
MRQIPRIRDLAIILYSEPTPGGADALRGAAMAQHTASTPRKQQAHNQARADGKAEGSLRVKGTKYQVPWVSIQMLASGARIMQRIDVRAVQHSHAP